MSHTSQLLPGEEGSSVPELGSLRMEMSLLVPFLGQSCPLSARALVSVLGFPQRLAFLEGMGSDSPESRIQH